MIQCIMLHFENSKNEIIKDLKVNMEPLDHLSLLRIRIRWIRKVLASWIRKSMWIHGSGSKG